MGWVEARWALTLMSWEGPGRRAMDAMADEDAAMARSLAALREN